MIEIVFFAILSLYIFFRIWSVLGKKTGHEKTQDSFSKWLSTPEKLPPTAIETPQNSTFDRIDKILEHDQGFSIERFLRSSQTAFQVILEAFSAGDRKTLKKLLSPAVYKNFDRSIKERNENTPHHLKILRVDSEIIDVQIKNQKARIKVSFTSQQISGEEKHSIVVEDFWTFERNLNSVDPTWILVETAS